MRDVRMTKWFGFWSIWFAIGLHSPNHANHGKPTTKVWIVLPPDVRRFEKSKDCAPGLMFDDFLPIPDAEFLPFNPLVFKLVVCEMCERPLAQSLRVSLLQFPTYP